MVTQTFAQATLTWGMSRELQETYRSNQIGDVDLQDPDIGYYTEEP